ncbi:MAG: prepilin-type N-terminal cleavage/methylation domain-containing protein [Elusimicrobiaceae bacterium]|nr:prepilin-type N-terminal cleavage/methylation domain-containing protein [Elusimicrobiaceae bacterium]
MQNKNAVNHGFTLVELLIVVLIVGVLMSIALPMYQGAVDKSRWAKLLTPARTIANAEEAILMSQGKYTTEKDDLSISLPDDGEYTYTLYTTENGDDGNFVRLESDKLADVRLKRYYTQDENYPEMLFCEALSTNDRANTLCSKRLQGSQIDTTSDGYKSYILSSIDISNADGCGKMKWFWSSKTSTCYTKESDRCTANGMDMQGSGDAAFCGCAGSTNWGCQYVKIDEGGECRAYSGTTGACKAKFYAGAKCVAEGGSERGCYNAEISSGGKCIANEGSDRGCHQVTVNSGVTCEANEGSVEACYDSTINGGECIAREGSERACYGMRVNDGGVCEGHAPHSCQSRFNAGSTCNGWVSGACEKGVGRSDLFKGTCNGYADGACGTGDSDAGYRNIHFSDGSVCNGYASGSCKGVFDSGSRCVSKVAGACTGIYRNGGCCVADGGTCPAGTEC